MPPTTSAILCSSIALLGLALTAGTAALWALGIVKWALTRAHAGEQEPFVSVIVAARNEEDTISECLKSLLAQDYSRGRFEIVVVDDHSTDTTYHTAQEAVAGCRTRVSVLRAPLCPSGIGPKKNALAFGIEHSRGELLLFTDADCRVSPRWIRSMVKQYDAGTGAVAGAVLPRRESGPGGTLSWMERFLVHYAAASAMGWGSPASANGGNLSYRRAAYDKLGGLAYMEVASGDDDLMVQALARAGWQVRFASGRDSVVTEDRISSAALRIQAAVRHQSTIAFYPWHWRLAFVISIACGALTVFTVIAAASDLVSWWFVLALIGTRSVIEIPAAKLFAGKLGLRLTMLRLIAGEILLPVYLLLRSMAALMTRYTWHNRSHQSLAASQFGGVG
jgi:hypothetical protein